MYSIHNSIMPDYTQENINFYKTILKNLDNNNIDMERRIEVVTAALAKQEKVKFMIWKIKNIRTTSGQTRYDLFINSAKKRIDDISERLDYYVEENTCRLYLIELNEMLNKKEYSANLLHDMMFKTEYSMEAYLTKFKHDIKELQIKGLKEIVTEKLRQYGYKLITAAQLLRE